MILWSPIKCLFETLSCHQRSHTGQRAQNIISYDVVPYFVDHKVPFFLSTLISPGCRVFRTTTRWTTPSSHTRKSYSSSTRLSTWSSSPCRWKPYVCYYMDISAFKNRHRLFYCFCSISHSGSKEPHRKFRPAGVHSLPARFWLQHWRNACPVHGAHGVPWSSRGTNYFGLFWFNFINDLIAL